jgi:hypothetical protein
MKTPKEHMDTGLGRLDDVERCDHGDCHVPASKKDQLGYWTCGNHESDKPGRAAMKLETGGWSVYQSGKRVLAGESYTVASNVEAGLNSERMIDPTSEAAEVVEAIKRQG